MSLIIGKWSDGAEDYVALLGMVGTQAQQTTIWGYTTSQ
jgi:hypothetical protein